MGPADSDFIMKVHVSIFDRFFYRCGQTYPSSQEKSHWRPLGRHLILPLMGASSSKQPARLCCAFGATWDEWRTCLDSIFIGNLACVDADEPECRQLVV